MNSSYFANENCGVDGSDRRAARYTSPRLRKRGASELAQTEAKHVTITDQRAGLVLVRIPGLDSPGNICFRCSVRIKQYFTDITMAA